MVFKGDFMLKDLRVLDCSEKTWREKYLKMHQHETKKVREKKVEEEIKKQKDERKQFIVYLNYVKLKLDFQKSRDQYAYVAKYLSKPKDETKYKGVIINVETWEHSGSDKTYRPKYFYYDCPINGINSATIFRPKKGDVIDIREKYEKKYVQNLFNLFFTESTYHRMEERKHYSDEYLDQIKDMQIDKYSQEKKGGKRVYQYFVDFENKEVRYLMDSSLQDLTSYADDLNKDRKEKETYMKLEEDCRDRSLRLSPKQFQNIYDMCPFVLCSNKNCDRSYRPGDMPDVKENIPGDHKMERGKKRGASRHCSHLPWKRFF